MTLDNRELQTQIEAGKGGQARWGMAGPDANNTETPTPIWGFGPPSPEPDTKKLDALLASLNGSAERFQTLWFSFLGLTLYLAIAALATTHRNLLLGEAQRLPILNIKVELLPFYVIAPLLYLVFHFYLLMMLVLLARTAAEFEKELRGTLPDEADCERYRARVENALFLQLLVGMKGERTGVNAFLLSLIALITIVLAPLATLILMQIMFLPYHSFGITWWHRALVLADVGVVLIMWRRFFYASSTYNPLLLFLDRPWLWGRLTFTANVAVVTTAFWLSFWEGRWAGEPGIGRQDRPATENGVVFGLFPDRLNLTRETIVGEKTLEETKKEIASRRGDFVPTIKFDERDLQAANLSGADLRGVSLSNADMQGANFGKTRLDGAGMVNADLQWANLSEAQLQGADLLRAQFQGADLTDAQLTGANLSDAQLQGAMLNLTELQGADLLRAQFQGADLRYAQLTGADLSEAQLQGADLAGAQLQGADLSEAQLQGANLSGAQLQGADLPGAELSDSIFADTFVFRANVANAHLSGAAIGSIHADQLKLNAGGKIEPLAWPDIETWIAPATQLEKDKSRIAALFARLRPDFRTADQDAGDRERWNGLEELERSQDPDGAKHRQRLTTIFGDLACGADAAPYVARALMSSLRVANRNFGRLALLGDQLPVVRSRMEEGRKEPHKCPGVAGFTEEDWGMLDAIKHIKATTAPRP